MDRKEALENLSIVTGWSVEDIEAELERLFKKYEETESSQPDLVPRFLPKPEIAKPLTPKQYGIRLLKRKKKRK